MDATDNSLPQFKKTPHLFSLASVDMTLLTTLILVSPYSLAILNGISRSMVSPDYEIERNPPCFRSARSLDWISEAILA